MGQRRMMSKLITDDDNFINLSSSAQALYMHLVMAADDEGFTNAVTICLFKAHATADDIIRCCRSISLSSLMMA